MKLFQAILGFAISDWSHNAFGHQTSTKGASQAYPVSLGGLSLLHATAQELSAALRCGRINSVDLVEAYLDRIAALDGPDGMNLNSVIETAPRHNILALASKLDAERLNGTIRSPLHGIPIIVKDNFNTDVELGMNSTAGSYALLEAAGEVTGDAFVIQRLREAGALIIAKANLWEWSGGSGRSNAPAWSPRGGQCSSPYVEGGFAAGGDPGSSSSGSGVSVSSGFSPISLGSDTEGSIVDPASRGSLFGLRPSTGMTSRSGVIPIMISQDTTGPLAKSVWDLAVTLGIMAAHDSADPFSEAANPFRHENYTQFLNPNGFQGLRIGIPRYPFYNGSFLDESRREVISAIEAILPTIASLGATIIETPFPNEQEWTYSFIGSPDRVNNGTVRLQYDIKADMAFYLQNYRIDSSLLTVQDLIDWNNAHPKLEHINGPSDQAVFIAANELESRDTSADYWLTQVSMQRLYEDGPRAVFKLYDLDLLLVPTENYGSRLGGVGRMPVGTVPLGHDNLGLPYGMAFVGDTYDEPTVIRAMSAFEANFPCRAVPNLFD